MRRAIAVSTLFLAAVIVSGCSGKKTALICDGTVQKVGKPETQEPVRGLAASITKWPAYVKLYNKFYGEFRLSEPYFQYFSDLDDIGDQILIGEAGGGHVIGMFNKITGSLKLNVGSDLYEVTCRRSAPITP